MRILIYEPWLDIGGMTTFARFLRQGLEENGCEVVVIGSPYGGRTPVPGIADFLFNNQEKTKYSGSKLAIEWLKDKGRFDLAIVNSGHAEDRYSFKDRYPSWLRVLAEYAIPWVTFIHERPVAVNRVFPRLKEYPSWPGFLGYFGYSEQDRASYPSPYSIFVLPYRGPTTGFKLQDRPKSMLFTSRLMKGKGADTSAFLANKFQIPLEMYGWYQQHRAGTTEAELKASPYWDGPFRRFGGEHRSAAEPDITAFRGVYGKGRVHLNLNRWPDQRKQPEYVSLEAIGHGCIPVAREEHFQLLEGPEFRIEVPLIRKIFDEYNHPTWPIIADSIRSHLELPLETYASFVRNNFDYLETYHDPKRVSADIINQAARYRSSTPSLDSSSDRESSSS